MIRCNKCLLPKTAPNVIFEDGTCLACINYTKRSGIDWNKRHHMLAEMCDKHRRNGRYDCVIPVSGGKDSHYVVYKIKEEMNMNPLLITVGDPFTATKAGQFNLNNLGETFNCDHLEFNISRDLFRRVTRIAFEELGEPLKFVEMVIYLIPYKVASMMNIPFIVFGENSAYEYGCSYKNNMYVEINKIFDSVDCNFWTRRGISKKEMNSVIPSRDFGPEAIFMSYFYPWGSRANLEIARNCGFIDLSNEWKRLGYIEDFEQIDSVAYLFHLWMKYPKFGFQRTTDIVSRRIREGVITKDEGMNLIQEHDHKLDPYVVEDFITFTKYTPKEFREIIEKWWNCDLFFKTGGIWNLK